MSLVVGRLPITHHSHNVGESDAGTVVFVGIEEDTKTLETIRRSKDRALSCALLGEPQREAISMEISGAMYLKLDLNLPDVSVPNILESIHNSSENVTSN